MSGIASFVAICRDQSATVLEEASDEPVSSISAFLRFGSVVNRQCRIVADRKMRGTPKWRNMAATAPNYTPRFDTTIEAWLASGFENYRRGWRESASSTSGRSERAGDSAERPDVTDINVDEAFGAL